MHRREQLFNEKFPLSIVGVLAIVQLLTTAAIVTLEILRIIINIRLTNLFAGFWTAIPFTILWISMFATVCCCRRRSCATHAVIQNIISLLFAGALISINIVFLVRPNDCFFTREICENLASLDHVKISWTCVNDTTNKCKDTRLALIQSQLACAILMALTCLIYLIVYCTVRSRANRRRNHSVSDTIMAPVYQSSSPPGNNYTYTNNAGQYQPSTIVRVPGYQPVSVGNTNGNYMPVYPQIPTERF